MHDSVMKFLRDSLRPKEFLGKEVLEVGSQDVNGSPKEVIAPFGPKKYIGVDFGPGRGVDLVVDSTKLVDYFGAASFDVVVSTEMLEHAQHWRPCISQMKEVLKPGGLLVVTARGPGCPYHGWPHDYWRYTVEDFRLIFSDMDTEICKDDDVPGVLFKGRKTARTGSVDLSKISIRSIDPPSQPDGKVERPKLSVIIPTNGRHSIITTILSLHHQLKEGDEVLVVGDGPQPWSADVVRHFGPSYRYLETPRTGQYGHFQRTTGMQAATGDYLSFMDDDDVYLEGAFEAIRDSVVKGKAILYLFRMKYYNQVIWDQPKIEVGNVGTQMIVVKNDKNVLGVWGRRPESPDGRGGDFNYIQSLSERIGPGQTVFRKEVISQLTSHAFENIS